MSVLKNSIRVARIGRILNAGLTIIGGALTIDAIVNSDVSHAIIFGTISIVAYLQYKKFGELLVKYLEEQKRWEVEYQKRWEVD